MSKRNTTTTVRYRYQEAQLRNPDVWDFDGQHPGGEKFIGGGSYIGVGVMRPLDEMLALVFPDSDWRADSLHEVFFNQGLVGVLPDDPAAIKRLIRKWQRDGLPDQFHKAAKAATRGRLLTSAIGQYLERITFLPEAGPTCASVRDFPALASWSVWIAVQETGLSLQPCEHCGLPWVTTARARYCERAAPDSPSGASCRDVAKVRDFRARQRAQRSPKKGGTEKNG